MYYIFFKLIYLPRKVSVPVPLFPRVFGLLGGGPGGRHYLLVSAVHGALEAQCPLAREDVDKVLESHSTHSHLAELNCLVLQNKIVKLIAAVSS